MDVDGGAYNSEQPDLEQSLLQEFSRMGTTDKEELISQMQKLLGPGLNYNTASFFLDMNNWNLQEATCCYLDFQPTIMPPSVLPPTVLATPAASPLPALPNCQMKLIAVKPITIAPQPPGIQLQWAWVVRNSGTEDWPEGCYVRPIDSLNSIADVPVAIEPKKVHVIRFTLTTPSSPGPHSQAYRLFTPQGQPFGDELWVNLIVQDVQQTMQCMEHQTLDENMC